MLELELELGFALVSGVVALGVVGVALGEAFWSVDEVPLFIEPVALLCPLVPVELVVPTWFWLEGLVVVVVVVWLPSGLVWLCDIVVDGEVELEFD